MRLWTAAVVGFGLVQVGRAVSRFVTSVSSYQARVFPWRHLAGCGVCLLSTAVALIISLLVWDPFSSLLSRGQITGSDIADVGTAFAAGLCLAGAFVALVAAAVEFRAERAWRHP